MWLLANSVFLKTGPRVPGPTDLIVPGIAVVTVVMLPTVYNMQGQAEAVCTYPEWPLLLDG